jgi:acetyl-CoA carboxylase carboxyl transferase subunit beta
MLPKSLFKKPRIALEGETLRAGGPAFPPELCTVCPGCKKLHFTQELAGKCHVCDQCGHHFRLSARQRLALMVDEGSFAEMDAGLSARDPLAFPDYEKKLSAARQTSGEEEAVVTGTRSK